MIIAIYSINFGFVAEILCFESHLMIKAGVNFSPKMSIISWIPAQYFGSPILSAKKGITTLAALWPTLKADPNDFYIN